MKHIEVQSLYKTYHSGIFGRHSKDVVQDVSFTLERGGIYGLLGLSGSGKTTLGRMTLGMEDITSGHIYSEERNIHAWIQENRLEFCRKHQMMFQNPFQTFHPYFSMKESLDEVYRLHPNLKCEEPHDLVNVLLDETELSHSLLQKYPRELSGGQLQRFALLRILLLHPTYLVLDEPTSMLDSVSQYKMIEILQRYNKEYDMTYLFISHDLDIVNYLCDTVFVLDHGTIIERGPCKDVMANPQSTLLQELKVANWG